MSTIVPLETFDALSSMPGILHAFTLRVPGLDVHVDRDIALTRLDRHHREARGALGAGAFPFVTATQVHGRKVVEVGPATRSPAGEADALVTDERGVCLGVYVADCCAIYFVDRKKKAIGLAHSGRKGTDLEIAKTVIETMRASFGTDPQDLVVQLSPCVRPPHYEVDFASAIVAQCREAGIREIYDCGSNTGADLKRYYSYRMEKGRTGRMLALLAVQ